jgi:hypothetical protein
MDFRLAVEEEILALAAILDGIDRMVDVETGLQELHAHILTALWLVKPNAQTSAAAEKLYNAAQRVARGRLLGFTRPGNWQDLNEALARFQSLLQTARPSERAKQASLIRKEP